ncbi:hypothetical protein Desca_1652 [Desulfotomaculum nigrificans CO-1-SRB]|uniref:Uncharacterized protein n=1 Tax=Desulfotomaculum nigrificans (strain DSM 14880 / VKM B-2319 / CO-1-SRB) TaxID=868595 RepID=F6B775_DESCC|nr:hypothetical protein Desca_1652 [Desulfotomaculum nigrificans CO-1-SRB]
MAQYKLMRTTRQLTTPDPCRCYQNDHVDLVVEGAGIRLCRLSSLSVPAEVSAYIPRVEVRHRRYENGQLVSEDERIYNSITVVHAPRHPRENLPKPPMHFNPGPSPGTPFNGQPPSTPAPPTPPPPGQPPPPPEVPTAPGPEQPGAAPPPVIPSQPEPHPPPVSPREEVNMPPFPPPPANKIAPKWGPPVIKINKRTLG